MFSKNSAFVKLSARRPPARRKSEIRRTVHAVYAAPPRVFPSNKTLNDCVARLYWAVRSLQFRLFFQSEEADVNSLDDLNRFEPPERPPSLGQLQEMTGHRFSDKWLKYMYNRFKNECPSGRMKFPEFKRLFGVFIPDRLNDAYLERMFFAYCQNCSSHVEYLTFKDLVVSLYRVCDENARSNAEWTMRLIGREKSGQVSYQVDTPLLSRPKPEIKPQEFFEFVKSVYTLRGRGEFSQRKRRSLLMSSSAATATASSPLESTSTRKPPTVRSVALLASAITTPSAAPAIAHFGSKRGPSPDDGVRLVSSQKASAVFKELDEGDKGFLSTGDFEQLFSVHAPLIYVS